MQRFAQRLADSDDDEHQAQHNACDHRIERPEERLVDLEGQIDQELNEHGQSAAKDQHTAVNVKIPAAQIVRQGNCRADEKANRTRDRESKGTRTSARRVAKLM